MCVKAVLPLGKSSLLNLYSLIFTPSSKSWIFPKSLNCIINTKSAASSLSSRVIIALKALLRNAVLSFNHRNAEKKYIERAKIKTESTKVFL